MNSLSLTMKHFLENKALQNTECIIISTLKEQDMLDHNRVQPKEVLLTKMLVPLQQQKIPKVTPQAVITSITKAADKYSMEVVALIISKSIIPRALYSTSQIEILLI
jgi:hypothetical protein